MRVLKPALVLLVSFALWYAPTRAFASQRPDTGPTPVPGVLPQPSSGTATNHPFDMDRAKEILWGSIFKTEESDAILARVFDNVPILSSGIRSIDGQKHVSLYIDRDYRATHGLKKIYQALVHRFPQIPIHVESIIAHSNLAAGKRSSRSAQFPTYPTYERILGQPLSFAESPNAAIRDNSKKQHVAGRITVPDDVMVGTVSVAVNISHSFRSDLVVDLVAPNGVATTLYNGIQKPVNSADDLIGDLPSSDDLQGQPAQGEWRLAVGDYEAEDSGTLHSWTLTITPLSAAQKANAGDAGDAGDETDIFDLSDLFANNIFSDTFQNGLGLWQQSGTGWEARTLGRRIAGEEEESNNIVARARCSVCDLVLKTPLDLSQYQSVTLSFYRWLDEGTDDGDLLGVEVGNGGMYKRLGTWGKQDGDGRWYQEKFTIDAEDLGDEFSVRFFAQTESGATIFAIDNVEVAAGPGSIIVEPAEPAAGSEEPEPEEEPEPSGEDGWSDFFSIIIEDPAQEPGAKPDIAVANTTASPTSVRSGDAIRIRANVANEGTAAASSKTVRVFRHVAATTKPRNGGVQEGNTTETSILAAGVPGVATITTRAPTVASRTKYYYYVCVDADSSEQHTDNNCSQTPAEVTVLPQQGSIDKPDLVVSNTTASPTSVQSGGSVTVSATVRNSGARTAESNTVSVYRHTARKTDPRQGGERLSTFSISSRIGAGASTTVKTTKDAPNVSAPKKYYFYVCADTDSQEQHTDNNCSQTPAEVTVLPKEEKPDLAVSNVTAAPTTVQEGAAFSLKVNVSNRGDARSGSTTLRVIRHQSRVQNPTRGGVRENTKTINALSAGSSVNVTSTHEAPAVTVARRYYYYVCVDTDTNEDEVGNNCSSAPAEVLVQPKPVDTGPPYESCWTTPDRGTPMGGDTVMTKIPEEDITSLCATMTLGGVETVDGKKGAIVSAHFINRSTGDDFDTNVLVGHTEYQDTETIKYLLGKVFALPRVTDKNGWDFVETDAAFVVYPRPASAGCSSPWRNRDGEAFCLDEPGHGDYLERSIPLTVRGENGMTHKVVGSQKPTPGLGVILYGTISGPKRTVIDSDEKIRMTHNNAAGIYVHETARTTRDLTTYGDSGGPLYTVPDSRGRVRMIGVIRGRTFYEDGTTSVNFSSWDDTAKEFNLKPLK